MIDHGLSVDTLPERRTPKVGDRVRVRLSAECRTLFGCYDADTGAAIPGYGEVPHSPEIDGSTGVVTGVEGNKSDHIYDVAFDQDVLTPRGIEASGWFALTELEPLDGAP